MTENGNTLSWENPKLSDEQQKVLGNENYPFGLDEIAVGASPEHGGIPVPMQNLVDMAGGVENSEVVANLSKLAWEEEKKIWDNYHRERASKTDSLTGLPNRQLFYEEVAPLLGSLAHSVPVSERQDKIIAGAIFFDVDKLKDTNDMFGHIKGDELIQACVKAMRGAQNGFGVIGRFGGDEFTSIWPFLNGETVETIAERLTQNMGEASMSVGIVPITAEKVLSMSGYNQKEFLNTLLHESDELMYHSKKYPDRAGKWFVSYVTHPISIVDGDDSWKNDVLVVESLKKQVQHKRDGGADEGGQG